MTAVCCVRQGWRSPHVQYGETRCEGKPCKVDSRWDVSDGTVWHCKSLLERVMKFHESFVACPGHGSARFAFQNNRLCDEASWKTGSGRSSITLSIRVPISQRSHSTSLSSHQSPTVPEARRLLTLSRTLRRNWRSIVPALQGFC